MVKGKSGYSLAKYDNWERTRIIIEIELNAKLDNVERVSLIDRN